MNYSFASSINFGNNKGYDYFIHNSLNHSFCLSDGANSVALSNLASKLTCNELSKIDCLSIGEVEYSYTKLDNLLIEKYPGTACTSAHIKLFDKKLFASHCGDTLIEIFNFESKSFFFPKAGKWSMLWQNHLDELDDQSGPSQLLGSNAFLKAHIETIEAKSPLLILMSTDGLHRYTLPSERLFHISQINNNKPSENDLHFICETLCHTALAAGSADDISIASIWYSPF